MRNRRRAVLAALPAAAALLAASASPAAAQAPVPTPVAADAGAGLFVLRSLPGATFPGQPGSGALSGAVGLTQVTADSTKPANQLSTATSAPFGLSVGGTNTPNPTALSQSALPDNPTPKTGGFPFPDQLGPLISGGLLQGSVQARWSATLGPCVDPISTATTSLASLSAVNTIPALAPPAGGTTDPNSARAGLTTVLTNPAAGLGSLGATLTGAAAGAAPSAGATPAPSAGSGSVVTLPATSSATSTVKLVDVAGQAGKGIQAQSTVQLADLTLLSGTPLQSTVKVISQPTLTATSTGDAKTSSITYRSPVLSLQVPGQPPITLDADGATPAPDSFDIPLTVPVVGGATAAVQALLKTLLGSVPAQLPTDLNLGVLRIRVGKFTPVQDGASVGGAASLLDIALLPTAALAGALGNALPAGPTSLLQIGVGEQAARASVPPGGVNCTPPSAPAVAAAAITPQAAPARPLAFTTAAYATTPLVWTGTGLLLLGAVLVAALPRSRRRRDVTTD